MKKAKVDTLILGCTHYPLLKPILKKVIGKRVTLIDSAKEVGLEVKRILEGTQKNRISKRKASTLAREGIPRIEIPLPITGSLAKFTELVMSYYDIAQEEMFSISRYRAH